MLGIITVNEENCVGCNKCVRNCMVFEANVSYPTAEGNKVKIDEDKCIMCGKCIEVCEHDARGFSDDTETFFADLESGKKITSLQLLLLELISRTLKDSLVF
jgi:dissimilatory sulfite reductase (desulfoviridin) alpha/beta subunit